jgi:hypothetical protein
MGKYDRLSEHLAAWPTDEWRASFAEVEKVLGSALPKTARTGRAWWANDPDKSHSRAWTTQGWAVSELDPAAEQVVFRKATQVQPAEPAAQARAPSGLGAAIVAGGIAVVAGLTALVVRGVMRRR